jgi:hypothetical protein
MNAEIPLPGLTFALLETGSNSIFPRENTNRAY